MDILTDEMTVYICDDNQEHMNTLHQKLERISRRIAIEEFISSSDLLIHLEELQNQGKDMPGLILLDIKMPEENGIQIGKKIRELAPELCLVFVTAYAEYAVQGYEARAFRYLLKPVTKTDLQKLFDEMKAEAKKMKKILLRTRQGERQLLLREIMYISAEDKYSVVYTKDEHYISDTSLTDYELRLAEWGFFRIHRKYLLNLHFQKGMERGKVLLANGQQLPVSKQRLKAYQDHLFRCMKENLL